MRNCWVAKLLVLCWFIACSAVALAQPTVTAINRNQPSPTNANTLSWSFIFNEAVSGVTTANFTTSGSGTLATISSATPAPGNVTWIVTVTGATGDGLLAVDLSNPAGIVNGAAQPMATTHEGPAYTLDNTEPAVTTISLVGLSPTSASTLDFLVTFSEPVTGVGPANFSPAGSLSGTVTAASTADGGLTWLVTVSGVTGSGTLGLDLTDTTGIRDFAQNNLFSDFTGNNFYIVDQGGPTVVSITRLDPSPTAAASVRFLVTFDEPTTGAALGNFTVVGVGTTGVITNVSNEGTTAIVTVGSITGEGTLGISLTDPTGITDSFGNPMTTTFSGGEVYVIDRNPPTVTQINLLDPNPTNTSPVRFEVIFSEPVTSVTLAVFRLVTTSATVATIASVIPSDLSTTSVISSVTITVNVSGTGTVALEVIDNSGITDVLGNPLIDPVLSAPYHICGPTPLPIQLTPPNGFEACESPRFFSWTVEGVQTSSTQLGQWSPVTPLPPNANAETRIDDDPAVATDKQGNWVAVWTSVAGIGNDFEVHASRSSNNGQTWTIPAPVNTDFASDVGNDIRPEIATDGNGNWVAIWMKNNGLGTGSDDDIFYSRSTNNGGSWSPLQYIDPAATSDSSAQADIVPSIAATEDGTFVAVWGAHPGTGNQFIKVARSTDGGATFQPPALVAPQFAYTSGPLPYFRVAGDTNTGTWVITCHSTNVTSTTTGNDFDVIAFRSIDQGATWSAPIVLNAGATSDLTADMYPHIGVNEDGTWMCAWTSVPSPNRAVIRAATSNDGALSWNEVVEIGDPAVDEFMQPFVVSGAGERWLIAWEKRRPGDWDIVAAETFNNGTSWFNHVINTNAAVDTLTDYQVQLGSDGAGQWLAVWNTQGGPIAGGGPDPEILVSRAPFLTTQYLDDPTTYVVSFDGGTTVIETTGTSIVVPFEFGPGPHTWTVSSRNPCGELTQDTTPYTFTVSAGDSTGVNIVRTDGTVHDLLISTDTLYIAGDFTKLLNSNGTVMSTTTPYLAAIDLATSAIRPLAQPDAAVHTMALNSGALFIGGNFTKVGNEERARVAAVDSGSSAVLGWRAGANGLVRSIAVIGSTVYFGGDFTKVNGYRFNFGETWNRTQNRLAAFTADISTTGTFVVAPQANASVHKIASYGADVMVAGAFSHLSTATSASMERRGLAVLDGTTHEPTAFDLQSHSYSYIYDFERRGNRLYLAGFFNNIGGVPRQNLAAVDVSGTSPTVTAWAPTTDRAVSALALDATGTTVFAGGDYTIINGKRHAYLAGISAATGDVTTCFYHSDNVVRDIEATMPGRIFVGGSLTRIGVRDASGR